MRARVEKVDVLGWNKSTTVMTMSFLMKKIFKGLQVMEDVEIFILRPATVPQVIMKVWDICLKIPATLSKVIAKVVEIGQL